jgi:translation initiation factor 4A
LARGIDVQQCALIVNFDLPMTNDNSGFDMYYHRAGLCGRFGRKGVVINLAAKTQDMVFLERVQARYSIPHLDEIPLDNLSKVAEYF